MKRLILLGALLMISLASCSAPNRRVITTTNHVAALPADLPANPLQWKIITSEIDHQQATMSTLFGNDLAVQYARTHSDQNYPPGSVLSLVTWKQQEDIRWFGAKIPADPHSIEFVSIDSAPNRQPAYTYRAFDGTPLRQDVNQVTPTPQGRAAYIVAQRAAVLP
jgi:Cytochrome P460